MQVHCIYVGRIGSQKENFAVGMARQMWGAKELNRLGTISKGDEVIFVHQVKAENHIPGFPRVDKDDFLKAISSAVKVVRCRTISEITYSTDPIWPDETYPHRFKLEIIDEYKKVTISSQKHPNLCMAIRDSIMHHGAAVEFSPNADELTFDQEEGLTTTAQSGLNHRVDAHSWQLNGFNEASKVLDKSAFLHRGTGIPVEIRNFFISGAMRPGESIPITLSYQSEDFPAHIDMETSETARTRLFWDSAFSSLLRTSFPHHHAQYSQNAEPVSKIILRLNRLSGFDKYQVSFSGEVSDQTITDDVGADELEDRGPQTEGTVRYYYGKRYERNPQNRKEAIRIHGLNCKVCGLNFEKVYGERGADFIEVHHVKPIHTFEEEQAVDPQKDLIPLCSNCHRMIHRRPSEVLTVDELKSMFNGF